MTLFLFGISMGEVVLVFLVVLMLFGSRKIPELARALGKGMNEFRKAADDIKREFETAADDLKEDLSEIGQGVRQEASELHKDAQTLVSDIKEDRDAFEARVYGLDAPEDIKQKVTGMQSDLPGEKQNHKD
ncbi:twin-arginine translocase TatA/TatE family subunit [Geofilum sp. OHC36d9]|uniref:twin-arginine translocase TatA/TatE family subunit n=1 Tax=Geofilum sp. OHC36d9 TaxID=3458413 RepID=UPI004034772A